jgi:S1-C subfamily serine protease
VAGAEVIDVRPELAGYFGVEAGVLVVDVPTGTPAASAGLQPGDVIVELAGKPVGSVGDLRVGVARPGDALPVWIVRHGDRVRLFLAGR